MGIKLDWQVESEQTELRATDDPEARRRRHQAQRRLALLVAGMAGVLTLVAALVIWRLRTVDDRLRQDLLDTVEIEVTALRLGDYPNFLAIQRSASDTFFLEQSSEFDYYQELKLTHRVELTGRVLDAEIDDQRARVVLEERIDGVPYKVVWFYWHYEDDSTQAGWRRVPDDLTFWGDDTEIDTGPVRVRYRTLDAELAQALADRLPGWWSQGCEVLGCATPPPALHVEIVAERPAASVTWSVSDSWTLRITSPLVDRVRSDVPLTPELEHVIAQQVTGRLVRYAAGDTIPASHTDVAWVQDELARWLAGLVLSDQQAAGSGFINSLVAFYGSGVGRTVLHALSPTATLDDVMVAATTFNISQLSVDQLNALDWHSFFQWRLDLEWRLLSQPDSSGAFLGLYDPDDIHGSSEAALRLENPAYVAQSVPQVTTVTISRDAELRTFASADTIRTMADGTIVNAGAVYWHLTGGTWKRTN